MTVTERVNERERERMRKCEEGRRLVERRRKFGREVDYEEERRNEVNERVRDGRRVQSGGTRGARKAVVCRGPPHWHTVVRYDPHRTPTHTGPLTVINEVAIRQVLVQCELAKSLLIL